MFGKNWNDTKLVPFGTRTVFFLNITRAVQCLCVHVYIQASEFESVCKFDRNKGLQDVTILQALRKSPPQDLHYRKNKFISLHRGANSQNTDL